MKLLGAYGVYREQFTLPSLCWHNVPISCLLRGAALLSFVAQINKPNTLSHFLKKCLIYNVKSFYQIETICILKVGLKADLFNLSEFG